MKPKIAKAKTPTLGKEDARSRCAEAAGDPAMLFFDDFDDAIIGYAERDGDPVAVYCAMRIVEVLCAQGWIRSEAWEHLGNNVMGAWMGPRTPIVSMPINIHRRGMRG